LKRRDLLILGGGAIALPLAARAQQTTRVPRVGILSDEDSSLGATTFEAFAKGLRDLGYVEGRNVAFERRYAAGKDEALSGLAAELVRLQPNVILAVGTPAARAAKTATETIPIVFARIADPIGLGLVRSLARPGGNLTGVSLLALDIAAKWLDLLRLTVPDAKRVGVLWYANFPPASLQLGEIEEAARSLNLEIVPAGIRGLDDFEPAILAMVTQRAAAIIVVPGPIFAEHPRRIADLTAKAGLPAMFGRREQVAAGGLMSYGTNYPEMFRRAATYVDKILKGATPADIPVEQPTKFELVVNLKTAKALGLTVPQLILARADEVIE
jgi:putative ABC transport system substrate-binding protein